MMTTPPTGFLLFSCRACHKVFPDDEVVPDPALVLVDALAGNSPGGRIHQCTPRVFGLADLVGIQADPEPPAVAVEMAPASPAPELAVAR